MSGTKPFEIGIFTFGELTRDAHGQPIDAMTRTRDILEWARVADEAGLDVFGVGEHHREDFAVSSPAVVLAAAAAQTKNIRLTSTVTVLSSSDPVRVFEDFATLDLISGGRAEITAGRGAYVESFPLFGQKLERYDEYFEDRLDLLLRIREENPHHMEWHHACAADGRRRLAAAGAGSTAHLGCCRRYALFCRASWPAGHAVVSGNLGCP